MQKGDVIGGSYSEIFIDEILDAVLFYNNQCQEKSINIQKGIWIEYHIKTV